MTSQLKNQPIDFTFCNIPKPNHPQKQDDQNDNQSGFSPRLWSKNINSNHRCPSYPMITTPVTGFSDSKIRRKSVATNHMAMVEGRKEMMEILNDLPESCYELSLKDIVAKDAQQPEMKENKKGTNNSSISRSVSLDTGVILLKMFVPSSFGFKKHKVSRSTSMNSLQKYHSDAKECKARLFAEKKSDTNKESCSNNRRYTANTKNRYAEETLKPGCWFRIRSTSQKGCIFF